MFILKIVGACVLIMATSMYGFSMSNAYIKRIESLKELKKCIILLDGELRYNSTPIRIAMDKIAERNTSMYSLFLNKVSGAMENDNSLPLSEAWERAVNEVLENDKYYMKVSDKRKLIEFGRTIGNLDSDSRMSAFEGYLFELENDLNESNDEKANKVKLYKTIGIMSGLFITILIV